MENKVKNTVYKIIYLLWFVYAAYLLVYRGIILGQYANAISAVFATIIAVMLKHRCNRNEQRKFNRLNIIALIIVAITNFNFVAAIYFTSIERSDPLTAPCYNIDMNYLQKRFHYIKRDAFPQELPQDVDDCSLAFMPSVLQGTGYLCVSFRTSENQINDYISQYASNTIIPAFTVAEYTGEAESEVLQNLSEYADGDVTIRDLDLYIPKKIRNNYPDAEIYVISCNFDWNHPHSFCFCCDKASGLAFFSEVG